MATYFALQEKNRRRTKIIVVCFVLFFIWLGLGLDLALYFWTGGHTRSSDDGYHYRYSPHASYDYAPVTQRRHKQFWPIFTVIIGMTGVIVAWWSMSNASETVLKSMLARPADRENSPAERTVVNIVEEMSIASSLSPPKVWIIPDPDPNALAVGLKDGDYNVAVTVGLLKALNREELQGVIAHEIAHLKNQDTRLMTTLTVLVGLAALISEFVSRTRFFGGGRDSDSEDSRIGAIIFVLWIFSALLAPFVTNLMTLMVSREREYLADASSAQFTRNPEALAKALEKIAAADAPTQLVRPASATLCIASPAAADLVENESWFATHPPIMKRIERLRSIGRAS
jgi:heat shock protein HtpX